MRRSVCASGTYLTPWVGQGRESVRTHYSRQSPLGALLGVLSSKNFLYFITWGVPPPPFVARDRAAEGPSGALHSMPGGGQPLLRALWRPKYPNDWGWPTTWG